MHHACHTAVVKERVLTLRDVVVVEGEAMDTSA